MDEKLQHSRQGSFHSTKLLQGIVDQPESLPCLFYQEHTGATNGERTKI